MREIIWYPICLFFKLASWMASKCPQKASKIASIMPFTSKKLLWTIWWMYLMQGFIWYPTCLICNRFFKMTSQNGLQKWPPNLLSDLQNQFHDLKFWYIGVIIQKISKKLSPCIHILIKNYFKLTSQKTKIDLQIDLQNDLQTDFSSLQTLNYGLK